VVAAVMHDFARPCGGEDVQRLVEHLASDPVVKLLAGLGELAAEPVAADADAQGEAPAAEPVECRGLPGDFHRPPAGKGRDHRPEPNALAGKWRWQRA
jgi:hypothetical protein